MVITYILLVKIFKELVIGSKDWCIGSKEYLYVFVLVILVKNYGVEV